jgi:hypothetical protein
MIITDKKPLFGAVFSVMSEKLREKSVPCGTNLMSVVASFPEGGGTALQRNTVTEGVCAKLRFVRNAERRSLR